MELGSISLYILCCSVLFCVSLFCSLFWLVLVGLGLVCSMCALVSALSGMRVLVLRICSYGRVLVCFCVFWGACVGAFRGGPVGCTGLLGLGFGVFS